ncbi:hypothetical protein [Streptomyces spirodelae]|uniref:ESX-1 secretion-associated protein n=1 Tax=Streptomyces spirodelae TaxID=2812904 RepID=A0ABS3WXH5_9ACTN|nr:hypothetical protein [Streptomyces spirodelae]MBO8187522.1 hypothetical protein [Streptomyces spirodelae]
MGAMKSGETPEQARARAERLRQHAAQARSVAGSLGSTLDTGVAKATADGVWLGPYAERVSGELRKQQLALEGLANGVRATAQRWDHEAELLDKEAAAVPTGGN